MQQCTGVGLLSILVATTGCAHAAVEQSADPAEDARVRLAGIVGAALPIAAEHRDSSGQRTKWRPGCLDDEPVGLDPFDAVHGSTTARGEASRGGSDRAAAAWASAQYATVWTEYFGYPQADEQRGALLDWLTTRSMHNYDVLRNYHSDFIDALGGICR